MRVEVHKCETCNTISNDFHNEIGWINIHSLGSLSISGGRRLDYVSDHFRFIGRSGDRELDFCSLDCFIKFLYFSNGNFNNSELITLEDKLSSLQLDPESENRFKKIKQLIDKVELMLNTSMQVRRK